MGLTLGVFGQQQAYVPARDRNVQVTTANAYPLGSAKKGQRCELLIKAVPGAPSAAVAIVNAGVGGNPKLSVLGDGGRILSEGVPLEIYDPNNAVVVGVKKYDPAGSNFNAYIYPVDGSNESDRVPPLLVDQGQNRALGVTGITAVWAGPPALTGDLMLAWVAAPLGATPLPVLPGWTNAGVIQAGANPTVWLFYKIAVGGEPGETFQDLIFPAGTWAAAIHLFRSPGAAVLADYGLQYPQSIVGYSGVTIPFGPFGLWTGQQGVMPLDTRFATGTSPGLQVACFANLGAPYPGAGDIFNVVLPRTVQAALAYGGGGDAVANATLCAGAGIITDMANIEWHAVNLDPAMFGTPYPFQAGTITLGVG